jgi:hypothetical protein
VAADAEEAAAGAVMGTLNFLKANLFAFADSTPI